MKHKPLNEQVIVITGASSGIGLCTALLAAERGAQVVLLARSGQTLDEIVQAIAVEGGRAHAMTVDVSDREALQRTLIEILTLHGRIDTWVNNAGVAIYGKLDQVTEADSKRLFEINFWGVVNGSLLALPALQSAQGTLINVGSEVSEAGGRCRGCIRPPSMRSKVSPMRCAWSTSTSMRRRCPSCSSSPLR